MIERVVGRRIRDARVKQRLTLAEVAARTGLSTGMLSKVENAKVSSPISTYYRIAQAIGIHAGDLFSDGDDSMCHVIRKGDTARVSKADGGRSYSFASLGFRRAHKKMEPFILTYPPNQKAVPQYVHTTEEFLYVLKGRLEFHHAGTRVVLSPGDAVYFDARVPHGGRAYGTRPATVLAVTTNV